MSRYELLHTELLRLRTRQAVALVAPAVVVAALVVYGAGSSKRLSASLFTGLAALVVSTFVFHHLWRSVFRTYRQWLDRSAQIVAEIVGLRSRVSAIFDKHRERGKGEQFKKAHDLSGRLLRELEEALSVGMYRERREVFVTAFMRRGVAVRVTASIGSPYRCSAADNPARWKQHAEKLGCDEIRQYHNHPVHNGKTQPSATDFRTSQSLKSVLGSHFPKLRSFIIYWNSIREWKIVEYDDKGQYWLYSEFDAAA